jgi:hypothetical protein
MTSFSQYLPGFLEPDTVPDEWPASCAASDVSVDECWQAVQAKSRTANVKNGRIRIGFTKSENKYFPIKYAAKIIKKAR